MGNAARKTKTQSNTVASQNNPTTTNPYTITTTQPCQTQLIQQHLYQQQAVQAPNNYAATQQVLCHPGYNTIAQHGPTTDLRSIHCVQFQVPQQEGPPHHGNPFQLTDPSLRDLDEIDDIETICQPLSVQRPSLTTVRSDPQSTRLESILTNPQFSVNPVVYPVSDSTVLQYSSSDSVNDSLLPMTIGPYDRPSTPVRGSPDTTHSNSESASATNYDRIHFPNVTYERPITPIGDKSPVNVIISSNESISVPVYQRFGLTHEGDPASVCGGTPPDENMATYSQGPPVPHIGTVAEAKSQRQDILEEHTHQMYSPAQHAQVDPPRNSSPVLSVALPLQKLVVSGNNFQHLNSDSGLICMEHLQGKCSGQCLYNHRPRQYQWQLRVSEDGWEDFGSNSNEAAERRFCCPSKEHSVIPLQNEGLIKVNFWEMSVSGSKHPLRVRRLTTPSTESPEVTSDMLACMTVWLWYWEESPNHWVQFGQKRRKGHNSSADSSKIEKAYQESPRGSIVVSVKKMKYRLCFNNMEKERLKDKLRIRIRRRPFFS